MKSKAFNLDKESGVQTIDMHCHLFNKNMLSIRLLVEILASISIKSKRMDVETDEVKIQRAGIIPDKFKRIISLLRELFSDDYSAPYDYIQRYQKNAIFAPLMFDLTYAGASHAKDADSKRIKRNSINESFNLPGNSGVLMELHDELDSFVKRNSRAFEEDEIELIEKLLNEVREEPLSSKSSSPSISRNTAPLDTFQTQYKELLALKNKYPDKIKPFFAVDPRRPGVYDMMINAIENDGFTGVKLYAPNGYSPCDPRLDDVYSYCLDRNIPITAHCSHGGFASLENNISVQGWIFKNGKPQQYSGNIKFDNRITNGVKERADTLNHPELWSMVLDKYDGLKLNLAHYGIGKEEDRYEWSELILELMLKHPNLYTDLSCITDKEDLIHLWKISKDADSKCSDHDFKVTERIMYGSDFWLNTLFIDMETYLANFDQSFSENELKRIKLTNPKRFLGI